MAAYAHRSRGPEFGPSADSEPASAQAAVETGEPEWDHALSGGNAAALAMVTGASLDEESAQGLFSGALAAAALVSESQSFPESVPESTREAAPPTTRPTNTYGRPFDRHTQRLPNTRMQLTSYQSSELQRFQENWRRNKSRYEYVSSRTGVPPELIAAIHYRESSMNFNTYLHQGDPLGKPAVNHPRNIPVFHRWEDAAVHALNLKKGLRDQLTMTENTTDERALATYAEAYNGLGYYNRGIASPYVYAGTNQYSGGMYVADGQFSRTAKDRRLGVLALVRGLEDQPGAVLDGPVDEAAAWDAVLGGHILRRGYQGPEVVALQNRLNQAGFATGVDGDFGPATERSVRDFQRSRGLKVDGIVGPSTAGALDASGPGGTKEVVDPQWGRILAGTLVLNRGASGQVVRLLQEKLTAAGFPTDVDGSFGPATQRSVRAFQTSRGLVADGIVGARTAGALG